MSAQLLVQACDNVKTHFVLVGETVRPVCDCDGTDTVDEPETELLLGGGWKEN